MKIKYILLWFLFNCFISTSSYADRIVFYKQGNICHYLEGVWHGIGTVQTTAHTCKYKGKAFVTFKQGDTYNVTISLNKESGIGCVTILDYLSTASCDSRTGEVHIDDIKSSTDLTGMLSPNGNSLILDGTIGFADTHIELKK